MAREGLTKKLQFQFLEQHFICFFIIWDLVNWHNPRFYSIDGKLPGLVRS